VYILAGSTVRFRILDDADKLAEFDGNSIYRELSEREDGSKTTLQAYDDIIVAGKNLYDGKIIN
jgi:hypothetical protein